MNIQWKLYLGRSGYIFDLYSIQFMTIHNKLIALPQTLSYYRCALKHSGSRRCFPHAQNTILIDRDGIAKPDQWATQDSLTWWNNDGMGRWFKTNYPKIQDGIARLPLSFTTRKAITRTFHIKTQEDVLSQTKIFRPYTRAFAWNVLFSLVNAAYIQATSSISLFEQVCLRRANPLLDPFYHIKREENAQAFRKLPNIISELQKEEKDPSLHSLLLGIKIAAIGNAIDQFRTALPEDSSVYDLVDHRPKIIQLLTIAPPSSMGIAYFTDNAGEIMSDLVLMHMFLALGFNVVIFAKDRPYMVKDVMALEIPYLMYRYDEVLGKMFPHQPNFFHYLRKERIRTSTHPFTTSGLGFSSLRGLGFGRSLKKQGFDLAIFKGEAWIEQITDIHKLAKDSKVDNPWQLPICSLHVVKNEDVVFDINSVDLDMERKPVIMRLLAV